MTAFYQALKEPKDNTTKQTYETMETKQTMETESW